MDKRDTILIVDDMEVNRVILHSLFEREYNILEAENGEQALMLLEQYHCSIAVMLLDLVMPIKNGYQVLTEMGEHGLLSEVPVMVITAEGSADNEVHAFDLGASDIIMKPFEPYVVKRRVQNIVELNLHKLHLEELVEEQSIKLRQSNEVMIDALSSVIEYRSLESGQHILRIRMFTKILLEDVAQSYPEYVLDEQKISIIASASAMHDIGKIAIPDSILNKPGPLTKAEFEVMQTHCMKGCQILTGLDRMSNRQYLQYAYNICRYHHERWDGRGYPDGLKGDNIPLYAQVVGIADAYDALTTDRVYKKAFPHETAYNMILNGECGCFSPRLLECFKNVRSEFADLSHSYADGRSPKADQIAIPTLTAPIRHDDALDTLQLGQTKYFALLRYLDSTVMEVDYNTGIFHLVYTPSQDFELLRTGSCFTDAIRNFVNGSVHPDDRTNVLYLLEEYIQTFFEEGVMRCSRKYRVYHHLTGEYHWYLASLLRIDTGGPSQRKAMVVWRSLGLDRPAANYQPPLDSSLLRSVLGGVQKCRNDLWFTLVSVSEVFLKLLGYTEQELKESFQNHYLSLIYSADREEVLRQTRAQLRCGNTLEVEYRVVAKNGRHIWVLDKSQLMSDEDGCEYLYRLLVDITQSKKAQEELRLTLERHKIIMDQTNDIIFEWDMVSDQVTYSNNWKKKFGYQPIQDQISKTLPLVSHIYPEDIQNLVTIMALLSGGAPYGETEFRVARSNGRYIWCKIRATAQFDEMGKPLKAVGVIIDIDAEKRAAQALQDLAERDALTKLYNKSASRRQIEQYLENREAQERAALFIIDVDNFKHVNDSYGHMFGDAVLTEIANEIRKLFRNADAIARIGGDEFMVFMRRIPSIKVVRDRARSILLGFHNMLKDHLDGCPLSCSIGVSLCPDDGVKYPELFQKADLALYRAKRQGKNQYFLYDCSMMDTSFSTGEVSAVNTRIDSDDSPASTSSWLVQQAFRQLYQATDVEQAIPTILELVGRKFNVSRCYIFECSTDGAFCRDTFEWCDEGISSSLYISHPTSDPSWGGEYQNNFNETGIFYCPDVSKLADPQREILSSMGIKSILQCVIRDKGVFCGYVGFDDCSMRRMWTQEQIDAITFISELLSAFLLKKRAQDRALETAQDLRMVLDNQNSWIYVIDPDSYQLMYINAKAFSVAPEDWQRMCCYEAFMGRDKPCEVCPAKDIRHYANRTLEIHNPVLNAWALADASLIRWGNQEACLLTCHDITPYKLKCNQTEKEQNHEHI